MYFLVENSQIKFLKLLIFIDFKLITVIEKDLIKSLKLLFIKKLFYGSNLETKNHKQNKRNLNSSLLKSLQNKSLITSLLVLLQLSNKKNISVVIVDLKIMLKKSF